MGRPPGGGQCRMPRAHRDDKTAPARRHPLLAPAACVVGVTLFTFLPLLRNDFIDWDDPTAIVQNPRLNPPTLAGLAGYWGRPRLGEEFYVPLNYTAWWLLAAATRPAAGPLPPWQRFLRPANLPGGVPPPRPAPPRRRPAPAVAISRGILARARGQRTAGADHSPSPDGEALGGGPGGDAVRAAPGAGRAGG